MKLSKWCQTCIFKVKYSFEEIIYLKMWIFSLSFSKPVIFALIFLVKGDILNFFVHSIQQNL